MNKVSLDMSVFGYGSFAASPRNTISCEGSQKILFLVGARIPLTSGCTIVLGEINLVNLIEDWDVLEEYAGEKLGFYQLLGNDGIFEIRVQTGRVGFKREFEKADDPLLNKILDFCRKHRYIRISEHLRDEEFFK
jgi:hypothetical protein